MNMNSNELKILIQSHLHKMIRITVGHEIAIYKCVQLLTKCANKGNRITPIDQNDSNNVWQMVFGFPPVMSVTNVWAENRKMKLQFYLGAHFWKETIIQN